MKCSSDRTDDDDDDTNLFLFLFCVKILLLKSRRSAPELEVANLVKEKLLSRRKSETICNLIPDDARTSNIVKMITKGS